MFMTPSITNETHIASKANGTGLLAALYIAAPCVTVIPMSGIHVRCREARKRTGLSQEALAAELNVSRGAVAQWEMREGTWPSVENLSALARRSGLAFEYLGTGRGAKEFGPAVAEDPGAYDLQVESDQEADLLNRFRVMRASRRAALLELLKPER